MGVKTILICDHVDCSRGGIRMKENKPEIFIETLENGHFVKTPVGNIFLSFCMDENNCFNIHCENDKIIIHAAGNGPRRLMIEPLDSDRVAVKIIDIEPIQNSPPSGFLEEDLENETQI